MNNKKESNLAYGGQALIEGVLMRGQDAYAYTVKKPDGTFFKSFSDYQSIGKRIKFFGLPFIRGISGFIENMVFGVRILNKSAEIAFPEEAEKESSPVALFFSFALAFLFAIGIFSVLPYFLAELSSFDQNRNPVLYNVVSGLIRLVFFFLYLVAISFLEDTRRVFGYHGAEHKTINAYEADLELTTENVKKSSRLHPRCGTAFLFIVFLITIVVFPFLNIFFNSQSWYNNLYQLPAKIEAADFKAKFLDKTKNPEDRDFFILQYQKDDANNVYVLKEGISTENKVRMDKMLRKMRFNFLGILLQKLVHIISHILIGMPIVASISYELLKLSGKYQHNPLVKVLVAPGLFFQLFTTREPEDEMIQAAVLSLNMVLGKEDEATLRKVGNSESDVNTGPQTD